MSQRVPQDPPEAVVDPSARAIGMLGFGAAGMRVVRRWIDQVPAGTPVTWAAAQRADGGTLAELERLVTAARVGWRLMLAGPEDDVRAAREAAIGLGLVDAQIRCAITAAHEQRLVWCPHCSATTRTDVHPGERLLCSGCTVPLRVPVTAGRSRAAAFGIVDDDTLAQHVPPSQHVPPAHHVA